MPDDIKAAEDKAPPAPTVTPPSTPTPEPAKPEVIVPEVTKEPQWHLSREEWTASQDTMKKLADAIPNLDGIASALSPLVDAINDVTSEEQHPIKPKPFMRRKLWGKA